MPRSDQALSVSIILTSSREPKTLGLAVAALARQELPGLKELLIVSPDAETGKVMASFRRKFPAIRHLQDTGRGKPAALNLGLAEAKGDIIILTDGDVGVGSNVSRRDIPTAGDKRTLKLLLQPLANPQVGAVSGRPVSVNNPKTMLGYWSHFLTDRAAHELRLERSSKGQFFDCSGYLYAVRRRLVRPLPEDTLADDALISARVWNQGYKLIYVPRAVVNVKFPTTVHDWLRQKMRTIAAYSQPAMRDVPVMRSFFKEASYGIWRALTFAKTPQELWWTFLLFVFRIYVWGAAWLAINLRHQLPSGLWQRVETTK
jgi:cellulose synthase/poly-beta-1,6-N-acetylglucosamine synthase-like glycosyltransferase